MIAGKNMSAVTFDFNPCLTRISCLLGHIQWCHTGVVDTCMTSYASKGVDQKLDLI